MKFIKLVSLALAGIVIVSCQRESSNGTGWEYNSPKWGGFQKVPFVDQETGPGLLLIEGGTFTMGRTEQDVMWEWNNRARRVTVSSFYLDQTEVTNFLWCEYLYWIGRCYNETYPMVYKNALPDTLVWRSPLGDNEKFVELYLRHPAYRDYPVVGVSWLQANDFCKWRTDRVNEYILIREGILELNTEQADEETFNTDSYLAGQYDLSKVDGEDQMQDLDPSHVDGKRLGKRLVRVEDGILLPRYRLPTEAEWEFASLGLIGNLEEGTENIDERRFYPWDGHWVRQDEAIFTGQIRANFVRGSGDYMGVAGHLNDGGDITTPVESYWPNDYGLYHMAGNVSEWVMDTYRPLSTEDFDEFRPFRGNVFKTKLLNNEGVIDEKNGQIMYDVHGMKRYVNEFERVRYQRITSYSHDPSDVFQGEDLKKYEITEEESEKFNDTLVPDGIRRRNEANHEENWRQGYPPDEYYVSHSRKKDLVEIDLLRKINIILDTAIARKNNKYDVEASAYIQDMLFDDLFQTALRTGPDGQDYAFEIISMLREGFNDYILDTPGKLRWRNVTEEENIGRLNYRKSDYISHLDGDLESSIYYGGSPEIDQYKGDINAYRRDPRLVMYQSEQEKYGPDGTLLKNGTRVSWPSTLVSDRSKVYKGGSWKDRAYWLVAGSRRFLDEDKSTDAIGFRCAMDRVGSPVGFNYGRKKERKR